ncbi:MAG: chorismate synthase [Clostridiales Family XIII bacterium]|jgi:chorismate synthase|nr:chorismate synthase [Clostridiales Family XIII bacterium]
MNTWGNVLKLSIFGESHGPAVGIVIGGLPAGTEINTELIAKEMKRRAPGGKAFASARREDDIPQVISGLANGRTTGAPLTCLIDNKDARSEDYGGILRPGHADWTAFIKYGGYADMSGGGHFSGRLTAPLVFAGAVAKQFLAERGMRVYGRVQGVGSATDGMDFTGLRPSPACGEKAGSASGGEDKDASAASVGGGKDASDAPIGEEEAEALLQTISEKDFPASDGAAPLFLEEISSAKRARDSVGGVVETVAFGVTAGLGEPFFDSAESRLAALLFSVPAVKGVAFGRGFGLARLRGSEVNGSLRLESDRIRGTRNGDGGVLGGITNGLPLIVRVAIKPTPSIGQEQLSVDPVAMKEVKFRVKGRHDPCIVPRATPVIESCVALGLLDLMLEANARGSGIGHRGYK